MKDTLNSIYLKLDSGMQYLASQAVAQIIVKIIYSNENSMSAKEIKMQISRVNNGKNIDTTEIDKILSELKNKRELIYRNNRYSLSSNKRQKIDRCVKDSEERLDAIIDKYFTNLNTDRQCLKDWLTEITILFFESYSNEWISDIVTTYTNYVSQNAESIKQQIKNRTESNKKLDKEDRKQLPLKFYTFITTRESVVEDYLWEYGTSAFASKLIVNTFGIDKFTIETFKDSVCILDTNILLFIALGSKYASVFKALEKVYINLKIQPNYLYITQKEYENKILCQKKLTLSNYDTFGIDTISKAEDDFMTLALRLNCRTREAFERFFDNTLSIPKYLHENLEIKLLDNDIKLVENIEKAQNDQNLKSNLNEIFKNIVGRDKSDSALIHDIGLLEGVKFLRVHDDKKYFILSDEISINQYSKKLGTKGNLPLSLRIDTLINILAVNNDGGLFEADDYKPLFANIIRMGLIPKKETFDQAELYRLSQMNLRISTLPSDEVCSIAHDIHKKILDGDSDIEIRRELDNLVTKSEVKVKDEIHDIKERYRTAEKESEHFRQDSENLRNIIYRDVTKEYDNKTKKITSWTRIGIFGLFIICLSVVYLFLFKTAENKIVTFVADLIISILTSGIGWYFTQRKIINKRNEKRTEEIEKEVERKINNK